MLISAVKLGVYDNADFYFYNGARFDVHQLNSLLLGDFTPETARLCSEDRKKYVHTIGDMLTKQNAFLTCVNDDRVAVSVLF